MQLGSSPCSSSIPSTVVRVWPSRREGLFLGTRPFRWASGTRFSSLSDLSLLISFSPASVMAVESRSKCVNCDMPKSEARPASVMLAPSSTRDSSFVSPINRAKTSSVTADEAKVSDRNSTSDASRLRSASLNSTR